MFYNSYKWSITFENYESLHCTPETYIIFYSNYTSIKKNFFLMYLLCGGSGKIK